MEDEQVRRNVLDAIAVMTAWLETSDDQPRSKIVDQLVLERVRDPDRSLVRLASGLIGLAGNLLAELHVSTGRSASEVLQAIAIEYSG